METSALDYLSISDEMVKKAINERKHILIRAGSSPRFISRNDMIQPNITFLEPTKYEGTEVYYPLAGTKEDLGTLFKYWSKSNPTWKLLGNYYLRRPNPRYAKYKKYSLSPELSKKLRERFSENIPSTCLLNKLCNPITYWDLFKIISDDYKYRVFVIGGAIRDLIRTSDVKAMNDVDINYEIEPEELNNRLASMKNLSYDFEEDSNYFVVGNKKSEEYAEGFYIVPSSYSLCELESAMNGLLLSIPDFTIYDPTGLGYDDAKNRIYRAVCNNTEKWITHTMRGKGQWRIMKFALRGYQIADNLTYKVWKIILENPDILTGKDWAKMWKIIKKQDYYNFLNLLRTLIENDELFSSVMMLFMKNEKFVPE